MVAAGVAGTGSYPVQTNTSGGGGGGVVPFFYGSNWYVEKFASDSWQLTTSSQEFVHNINPGGFLRGVRVEVSSTGGVGGTAAADNPWNVFQSISLENIDGAPIQYPMSGYAYFLSQFFFRPWLGVPNARFDYAAGINPSFSLFMQPEIRHTAGVLANTDARALYRIRATVNTAATVITGGSTAPTLTINYYLETWAQPDTKDLHQNPIDPLPSGLNLATLRRHQIVTLNPASSANTIQLSNTGNEMRGIMMVVRDSNSVRQDYLTDPIRWRLDNRQLGSYSPKEVFNQMGDFYDNLGNGTFARPTGVYCWPRFYQPGHMKGQGWLQTTNATFMIFESTTNSGAGGSNGTIEIITDEVVPVGPVPMELESI
jgi:hypothetical protein